MELATKKIIWTVGHSTHTLEKFISLLNSFHITLLIDIRSFPGSRRYPQFNKSPLKISLNEIGMNYIHMQELGGRRKPRPNSLNTAWRNASFRGYADYMETDEFKNAIEKLEHVSLIHKTAYMCAEALWWRCHRSLVSDYLKIRGWTVIHIMNIGKGDEHPYTSAAQAIQGNLFYHEN